MQDHVVEVVSIARGAGYHAAEVSQAGKGLVPFPYQAVRHHQIRYAENLFARFLHCVRISLPACSFRRVGRRYVPLLYLLVSSPSLPAYPFARVDCRYVPLFYWFVSSPSVPAQPFTSVADFHEVYSCTSMT